MLDGKNNVLVIFDGNTQVSSLENFLLR